MSRSCRNNLLEFLLNLVLILSCPSAPKAGRVYQALGVSPGLDDDGAVIVLGTGNGAGKDGHGDVGPCNCEDCGTVFGVGAGIGVFVTEACGNNGNVEEEGGEGPTGAGV